MAKVIFTYNGTEIAIQCAKNDKMNDICERFSTKVDKSMNSLLFLYGGNKINFELTFKQQANSIDKNNNQMNILVYKNESDGLKCEHCGNIIHLPIIDNIIKYNNEQRDTLIETKNQIENIINLNNNNDIIRKIKLIKIIIDNLITENDKCLKEIKNNINNNESNIKKNNDYKFKLISNNGFTSNEEKIIANIIVKFVKQNLDYRKIDEYIRDNYIDYKEGNWTIIIGERDKFNAYSYKNIKTKTISGNIGPYKIIIIYCS